MAYYKLASDDVSKLVKSYSWTRAFMYRTILSQSMCHWRNVIGKCHIKEQYTYSGKFSNFKFSAGQNKIEKFVFLLDEAQFTLC
jgi:hypothetical protein